ncbi:MAG: hypothetical protein IJ578_02345 [Bacteroidales bacterium]|nr:hypothetical protein [Bacteroidales bacterium]
MSKSLFSNVWIKTLSIAFVALCLALPCGTAYAQGGESVTLKMRVTLSRCSWQSSVSPDMCS